MAAPGAGGRDVVFRGSLDRREDVAAAAAIASACGAFRRDDDDEDHLGGGANCFSCRYRRWAPRGFTCLRGALPERLPS